MSRSPSSHGARPSTSPAQSSMSRPMSRASVGSTSPTTYRSTTPAGSTSPFRPPLTEEEQIEELRDENTFLHRKVKMLEDAHLNDTKKNAIKEAQHKATIERLRDDNKRLREELLQKRLAAAGPANVKVAVNEAERILQLQKEVEKLRRMLDDERAAHNTTNLELVKLRANFAHQAEVLDRLTADDPLRDDILAARRIARLEQRLDQTAKAANERASMLEAKRNVEADYSVQISMLHSQIKQQQREIRKREHVAHDLEFQLRQTEAARDSAQSEVAALTLQFEREKEQWQREMRTMDERLRANRKVAETLMGQSSAAASHAQQREKDALKRQAMAHSAELVAKDTQTDGSDEERNKELQQVSDSLLKENSELAAENARLQRLVDELRARRALEFAEEEETAAAGSGHGAGSNQLIKQLEDKITESQNAHDRTLFKYEKLGRLYVDVKAGVEALCQKVGAAVEGANDDVVATADQNLYATVADERVLANLQRLEVRVLEMQRTITQLQSQDASQISRADDDDDGPSVSRDLSPMYTSPQSRVDTTIQVHNVSKFLNQMVEESDSEDDSNELLDRSRLKEMSMQKVKEKEAEEADERQRKHRFQKNRRRAGD